MVWLWPRYVRRNLFYFPGKFGANSGRGLSSKAFLEEHGDNNLADEVKKVLNSPYTLNCLGVVSQPSHTALKLKQESAIAQVTKIGPCGDLSPTVTYLTELGIELKHIEQITRAIPDFIYYNLEKKIQPLVEFLLKLGVPKTNIPTILMQRPRLIEIRLYERIIPRMTFLESLGVDKKKWAQVIYRYPGIFHCSIEKVNRAVDFLCEMGVSEKGRGRILTRWPSITGHSVEKKLRPTAEYFQSLGADVAVILHRCPSIFALSMEANLKPVTEFLLERGYSAEEVGIMACRFSNLYTLSLEENLNPKWEYFLTMNYPREELVSLPAYFGYSLEQRIKPRYALMKECGVHLSLPQLLCPSACDFSKALKRKIKKIAEGNVH